MSVILKALRAQQEEGASPDVPSSGAEPSAFQVDESTPVRTQGGGPGSNKRTIILLIILLCSIVLMVVLRLLKQDDAAPAPRQPAAAAPASPAPAAAPAPDATPPVAPETNSAQVARSQYKAGEYDESIKSFQQAIDAAPKDASLHNDLGLALLKKELYTSAENHFAKALELDDSCAECYNNLGYLKTLLNQPVEAESYLQKAVVLKPDYPDPYFNLAVMYEKNGDVGKAVAAYRNFLKKAPKGDLDMTAKIKDRIQELSGE